MSSLFLEHKSSIRCVVGKNFFPFCRLLHFVNNDMIYSAKAPPFHEVPFICYWSLCLWKWTLILAVYTYIPFVSPFSSLFRKHFLCQTNSIFFSTRFSISGIIIMSLVHIELALHRISMDLCWFFYMPPSSVTSTIPWRCHLFLVYVSGFFLKAQVSIAGSSTPVLVPIPSFFFVIF